ncbi:Flp pilus assembly protein CpaB [Ornithinimicrobium sp. Y1694]|uniref:Flp pilus assembly protein CpaB n=1 Tax=Ornithinimicrobium sp. Y1694 TaxID=3418590 RepID=UPI003CF124D5
MIKRVLAAVLALVLAAVGVLLVVNYANRADQRALGDQETVGVLVATQAIDQGTASEELAQSVEVRQIPRAYAMPNAVEDLSDLEGRVASIGIEREQQLTSALFVTPEQLRRQGSFALPEEAEGLHQLTINIPNPQALGGSVAPGDTVGVFGTFSVKPPTGWTIEDGALVWDADLAQSNAGNQGESTDGSAGGTSETDADDITFTDLLLDKVLVVRVEGGHVAGGDEEGEAADVVNLTLALEPQDAARVIFAMETASLWLTLSPEAAEDAEVDAVLPALPGSVVGVVDE